uniref:Synaptobrevin, longin-like domain protein n=1 Tax=Tanacetum cinerariifolium TaxID=118510 RepID=A0A6L2KLF5_TANCI|nr:hypothetical protein [Tanacetum cinerariifolium]
MAQLTFADTHNMVAFLSKSDASEGFDQIVDFLNTHTIQYALVVNPPIYVSYDVFRRDLHLDDADGVECLPNEEIFTEFARIGYEKPPFKLTFYKALFSAQWKFLIHTFVQCLSAKRTAWNEFSCSMASDVICLATANVLFIVYIAVIGSIAVIPLVYNCQPILVHRLKAGHNLMPRMTLWITPEVYTITEWLSNNVTTTRCCKMHTTAKVKTVKGEVQLQALIDGKKVIFSKAIDRHLEDAEGIECLPNSEIFEELARMRYEKPLPQLKFYKAFFSSQWNFLVHTLLQCLSAKRTAWNEFRSAMASAIICLAIDEGIEMPIAEEQPSTTSSPSTSQPQNQPSTPHDSPQPSQPPTPYDSPLTGVHTPRSDEEIVKLKRRVKKLERRKKSRTSGLQILRKVGSTQRVESSDDVSLGAQDDASKQRGMIAEIDADVEISLVDETKGRNDENDDNLMFDVGTLDDGEVLVKTDEIVVDTAVVDETVAKVSVDEPAVTTVSTPVTTAGVTISATEPIITIATDFSKVDMTLAKALAKLKTSKPKWLQLL